MFNVKPKARAFNAGQLSGLLAGRTDLEKYAAGCLLAENVLTRPQGPAMRRPGTRLAAAAAADATASRLIPFVFSATQRYVLEFGHLTLRVATAAGIVMDGDAPYAIETPYAAADLRLLQVEQSNDVMYIACAGQAPRELRRYGHTDWRLTQKDYPDGPFLDDNIDPAVTLAVGATTAGATGVALTATGGDVFTAGNVGGLFELRHLRPEAYYGGAHEANATSDAFAVYGSWELITHGHWAQKLTIERSADGGATWQAHRTFTSQIVDSVGTRNVAATGEEKEPGIQYRVVFVWQANKIYWTLTVAAKEIRGIVRVTAVTDARHAVCTVLKSPHAATATSDWREGAWSTRRGWPRAVGLTQGRVWWAGTAHQPTGVWATRAGDYDSMADGLEADDAIVYPLTDARQNPILWLADQGSLLAGTEGSEHDLRKINANDPMSGKNIESSRQSAYGSRAIAPVVCEDVVLFAARDGRKLREMSYVFEKDGYSAADLTLLSEDMTAAGIVEMAYQAAPDSRVWCVLGDGGLAVMGYERRQNVIGWTRIETDGQIDSVAVIPGDGGEDVVFWAVARQVEGTTRRFIEVMAPQAFAEQKDCFFVDCGLTFDGGAATAIADITLEGGAPGEVAGATGHWAFDEADGDIALDSSGGDNPGTLSGATRIDGVSGGAVRFTAATDHVLIPDAAALNIGTGDHSIAFFVRPRGFTTYMNIAFHKTGDAAESSWVGWFLDNHKFHFSVVNYGEDLQWAVSSATEFVADEWVHIALTLDRDGEMTLYVNGHAESSADISAGAAVDLVSDGDLILGNLSAAGGVVSLDGDLDTVLLFDRALTSEEVAILAGGGTTRVTITAPGHGLIDGNLVRLTGMGTAGWLDHQVFAADCTDETFRLKDRHNTDYIDGQGLAGWSGGGTVERVASVLGGLEHLEGRAVSILADGGVIPEMIVTDGSITLPYGKEANTVHVGLGYRSVLSPMPFEIPTNSGSSPGYKQRIYELIVHLHRSLGLKIGARLDQLEVVDFQAMAAAMNRPPGLYTGLKRIAFTGGYALRGELYVVQDEPLPMCILSIEPKMGVES